MLSPGKASCDSCTTQPTAHAGCFSVSIIHQILTQTTRSCAQMLMHAIAHMGVDALRESALKVHSRKKIPCHRRVLNLLQQSECWSNTFPTELHPHSTWTHIKADQFWSRPINSKTVGRRLIAKNPCRNHEQSNTSMFFPSSDCTKFCTTKKILYSDTRCLELLGFACDFNQHSQAVKAEF